MRPCTQLLPLGLSRDSHTKCWAEYGKTDQDSYTAQAWAPPGNTHPNPVQPLPPHSGPNLLPSPGNPPSPQAKSGQFVLRQGSGFIASFE